MVGLAAWAHVADVDDVPIVVDRKKGIDKLIGPTGRTGLLDKRSSCQLECGSAISVA